MNKLETEIRIEVLKYDYATFLNVLINLIA